MAHTRHWMDVFRMNEQIKFLIFMKQFSLGVETWQKWCPNSKIKKKKTKSLFSYLWKANFGT